jgi:hypothetical protein
LAQQTPDPYYTEAPTPESVEAQRLASLKGANTKAALALSAVEAVEASLRAEERQDEADELEQAAQLLRQAQAYLARHIPQAKKNCRLCGQEVPR